MVEEYDLVVRGARVLGEDTHRLFDVAVRGGVIEQVSPSRIPSKGAEELDAGGRLVLPGFFNMHFHLDSAFTAGRPRHNLSGTLWEGIDIWSQLKNTLSIEEIASRATRAVKWMAAYGTLWLRTHADTTTRDLNTVKALLRVREEARGLMEIQVTAFPQDGIRTDPENLEKLERALELGADNVGLIPHNEWTREDGVRSVEDAFNLAVKYGRDVDGHIDETDDPNSRYLEVVAANTIRHNWVGRVTAGHVTASHSWDPAYTKRIAPLVARAGVTVVPNPLVNMNLQGRLDGYPKRRGVAPIKRLLASGVNVALGHDCIMDPWYPLGVGDMLQVLFMAVHADQLTGQRELEDSISLITYNASKAWRNTHSYGVRAGCQANLIVANGYTVVDLLRTLGPPLYVVREGKIVARNLSRTHSEILYRGRWEKLEFTQPDTP